MHVQPCLFFDGRCEEALEFYRTALGAEVTELIRYNEHPGPEGSAHGAPNKIMHSSIRIGDATVWASDGRCTGAPSFQGFSMALSVSTEADAEKHFAVLSEGGEVVEPLTKTFFSERFGMTIDRFGVLWMVLVRP